MRFGKRLALAMIRDAGEVPYVSQKTLKHILVGLEKLCKSYVEQESNIATHQFSTPELVTLANSERLKYGLLERSEVLSEGEVREHDAKLFQILDADVVAIRKYVELCESSLMESVNEWMEEACMCGLLISESPIMSASSAPSSEDELNKALQEIVSEVSRMKQYVEVNATAMRKLISRRNKNVAQRFWSVDLYENMHNMKTSETEEIVNLVDSLVSEIGTIS